MNELVDDDNSTEAKAMRENSGAASRRKRKKKSCEFRGGSRSIPKPSFKTQFNFLEFSTFSPLGLSVLVVCLRDE